MEEAKAKLQKAVEMFNELMPGVHRTSETLMDADFESIDRYGF